MLRTVRVMLAIENHLFRQYLASALVAADSCFDVDLADSTDVMQEATSRQPDVMIIDLQPDRQAALKLMHQVTQTLSKTCVLVLGSPQSEREILSCLEAGATEYVSKEESLEDLRRAIDRASRGETACPPELAQAIFQRLRELAHQRSQLEDIDTMILTHREMQILELIAEGLANKQIAKRLHLSLHTVKNHVHRILGKLEARNRSEAVRVAHERRWLAVGAS